MTTDDDTGNFLDGTARIAVLLPMWKQQRCTLECVPQTSTQAAKQQKGEGNCAGHADVCRGRTLSTAFLFVCLFICLFVFFRISGMLTSLCLIHIHNSSAVIQFQAQIQKPRSSNMNIDNVSGLFVCLWNNSKTSKQIFMKLGRQSEPE